jgi:integrase/ubiquitin
MANRSIRNALSDTAIKSAKAKEKAYTMPDGNGLQLLIKPNGSKVWEVRYTLNGKTSKTTIGTYPTVKLVDARKKRDEYKELAHKGINPTQAKRAAKQAATVAEQGQFHLVVREWADSLQCSKTYADKRYRAIERDIFPYFCTYDKEHRITSSKHITKIAHGELNKAIQMKAIATAETAKRLYQDIKLIWEHAISHGYTEVMTPLKIKKSVLPKPKKKHYPKITDEQTLKELFDKIDAYKGQPITRLMLKFVAIVPLRAENLCKLRWEQVDLEKAVLTIRRAEMKVKDSNLPDFIVPLPQQATEVLKEVHQLTGWGAWVFHGLKNIHTHINPETGNKALRLMGFTDEEAERKQTLHSFRGTFRSLVETHRQEHGASFETMERCLDHQEKRAEVRAYSHKANYAVPMGELFQWWANFIDTIKGER